MKNSIFMVGLLTLGLVGCSGQSGSGSKDDLTKFSVPQQYGMVVGTVRDLNGNVIDGVKIDVNAQSVATNNQGYFAASRIPEAERMVVNFSKPGFVPQTKVVHTRIGENTHIDVMMAPRSGELTFNAGLGVSAQSGGALINIPPNSLMTADGQPYSGTARISVTAFDPTTERGMGAFPGKFEGVMKNGQVIPFRSLGFVDVTPVAEDGRPLQLRPGTQADLTVPIAAGGAVDAPETIPVWYMNPQDGQWHEEGVATRVGSTYQTKINHFSIWNCDVGLRRAWVTGRVVNCSDQGQPVRGARVSIQNMRAGWTSGEDSTPADGTFRIPVNADEPVTLWAEKGGQKSQTQSFTAPGDGQEVNIGDVCLGVPKVQIVLVWKAQPEDLDAHLSIPVSGGRQQVFFGSKRAGDAQLDTDDTTGFGPEIITVFKLRDGVYRYNVHHYRGGGTLGTSGAFVHMTIDGLGIFEMNAPAGGAGKGDVWALWDFEIRDGRVIRLTPLVTLENGKSAHDTSAFSPR